MAHLRVSILLLEPDAAADLALSRMLEKAGFRVELVHTCEQALTLLAAGSRPDLVLLDIDALPDGPNDARRLLDGRALPLILLTDRAGGDLAALIQLVPCYAVFPRSVQEALLLPNIQTAINVHNRHAPKPVDTFSSLLWVVEEGPLAVVVTDTHGSIEYANQRFCLLTGYTVDELLGHNPRILKTGYTSPEEYRDMWRLLRSGIEWRGVFQNRKKNGELYWEAAVISPIVDERGQVAHFIAVKENITERKQAELALQSALEREKILQLDIYHRTKNHLMQVMSLLDLQCALIRDPYDAELLIEVQNRVRSMALLNEFLYRSGDLQHIDFGAYARSLVEHLVETYHAHAVQLAFQFEPISMAVNQVLPCALILTELVSNALKHAFPPEHSGRISISMHQQNDCYSMKISDNGRGFEPGANWRSATTMGTQLVLMLAHQLEGVIELQPPPGANFVLTFPVE